MSPKHDHQADEASETPRPPRQEAEPATDEITEVADGIIRTQLPIEMPGLGHVNCYILEDERGIAVVDPGLPGDESWSALEDRLRRTGHAVTDIHTVVVTHSHFDHFGATNRIREASGADVLTHETFRKAWNDAELNEHEDSSALDEASEAEQEEQYDQMLADRLPWGTPRTPIAPADMDRIKQMRRSKPAWFRAPEPSITVHDSQVVRLARREWVAIHTPGHTLDHLCLFDPEHGVMITGDHVLPTITPHITGMSPQVDPLAEFFDSLHRMRSYSDVKIALPAHGHPFEDLVGRAESIVDHHEGRLDLIRNATRKMPRGTVTDYMKILFRERVWGDMAESETYAHLEHLRILGELDRADPDGVAHYAPSER